jgi:hypothetical protein
MALTKEQSLRQAIAREEVNLAALEQKRQKSRGRLAELKAELAAIASSPAVASSPRMRSGVDTPSTPKVLMITHIAPFEDRLKGAT